MGFLIVGVAMLALYAADVEPVAHWPWWVLAVPFGLTVLWWAISDSLGLTERRALRQMDERKLQRRMNALEALGLGHLKHRLRHPTPPSRRSSGREPVSSLQNPDDDLPRQDPRP